MRKIILRFYEFVSVKNHYLNLVAISIGMSVMFITIFISEYYYEELPKSFPPVIFLITYFLTLLSAFLFSHLKFYFIKKQVKKRPGKIVNVFASQFSCYLTWEYEYQGQIYRGSTSTFPSRSKWFRNGQSVLVTIDSGNPKNSFLEEIYE